MCKISLKSKSKSKRLNISLDVEKKEKLDFDPNDFIFIQPLKSFKPTAKILYGQNTAGYNFSLLLLRMCYKYFRYTFFDDFSCVTCYCLLIFLAFKHK